MKKIITIFLLCILGISCSENTKEVKSLDSTKSQTKKEINKDSESKWTKNLTHENAKNTAIQLLTKKNCKLGNWDGLMKISEYEIHGRASIFKWIGDSDKLIFGSFIFHRDIDDRWVLDKIYFSYDPFRLDVWNDPVFLKVIDE